jgi:chromosomal replication initiation ATPase DnaA
MDVANAEPGTPRQLVLDLSLPLGQAEADFLPSPCNRGALDAVLRWPSWPGPACLIVGPAGSGKTHLLSIWAERSGALLLHGRELWAPADPLRRLGASVACAVDEAEDLADETLLFHLYNRVAERQGSLLLSATRPLSGWRLALPDLRSRLVTAWTVAIEPPDDGLLAALLVKQFADRQIRVDAGVVAFLVNRIERSFAAVRSVVQALDRASLRARRPVTMPLARLVLDDLARERPAEDT